MTRQEGKQSETPFRDFVKAIKRIRKVPLTKKQIERLNRDAEILKDDSGPSYHKIEKKIAISDKGHQDSL